MNKQISALIRSLEALDHLMLFTSLMPGFDGRVVDEAYKAINKALAEQPAQQEPVAWKLVPTEPTEEMLKAMDECSKEGYDERLYAGHAASVYMAAVDAAPIPQAEQDQTGCACRWNDEGDRVVTCERHQGWLEVIAEWAERARDAEKKLKSLNTSPPAQRKPLTDEEIEEIAAITLFPIEFARAIEVAHSIKENT